MKQKLINKLVLIYLGEITKSEKINKINLLDIYLDFQSITSPQLVEAMNWCVKKFPKKIKAEGGVK